MKFTLFLLATALYAQKFEVAAIKPSPDFAALQAAGQRPHCVNLIDQARVEMTCLTLSRLVIVAYRIEPYQLTSPDWMATTPFDVLAKLPEGATKEQVPAMLQAMLAERFNLAVRKETKEESVYALTVGKDGPKLKEASTGDLTSEHPFPDGTGGRIMLYISPQGPDGWQTYSMLNGTMMFDASRITLAQLTAVLAKQVDLPVIDHTGRNGAYAVSFPVPHGPNGGGRAGRGGAPAPSNDAALPTGADIFKSVEKLGLRLEKTKAPIEHIVVEHADKLPTGN